MYQRYAKISLYVLSRNLFLSGVLLCGSFLLSVTIAHAQVSISGTLFENNGTTAITTGKTITAAIATSTPSLHSVTSNGSGEYTISGIATSTGGTSWTVGTGQGSRAWRGVTYGNGTFVAVACGSATTCNVTSGNRVMTSPDGITWTARNAAGDNDQWLSVTYGNGLFVAVGNNGDRVMTSLDGITWTVRSALDNNDSWLSVTYGNGLFVAVSSSGDRTMYSTNGIDWTAGTGLGNRRWESVAYGNGTFVAVGCGGSTSCSTTSSNRVATSPDGITWTERSAASGSGNNDYWGDVTYGNGLFVAASYSGDRLMTSPDGITWTIRSIAGNDDTLEAVTYGNGQFIIVASAGDRVLRSFDGISWATTTALGNDDTWYDIIYAENRFVAISSTNDRAMYSDGGFSLETPITVYVNGDTEKAATLLQIAATTSSVTGVDLHAGSVRVQHAVSAGVVDLANNDFYDSENDSDIPFTLSGYTGSVTGTNDFKTAANTDVRLPTRFSVAGDITNQGDTIEGTLRLTGTSVQTATGTGQYANLTIANTSGSGNSSQSVEFGSPINVTGMFSMLASTSAEFLAGATSTVGVLDLFGMEGSPVWLRSSNNGTRFNLTTTGRRAVQYANVKDSRASVEVSNGTNDGNNSGWVFGEGTEYIRGTVYTDTSESAVIQHGSVSVGFVSENESSGQVWTAHAAAESLSWTSVTYGNGLFVAIAPNTNRVMTSPDGITWTARSIPQANTWNAVTYGGGLFVAVGSSGDRVMTSPDGITWTTYAAGNAHDWRAVTYGNGTFVAVGQNSTGLALYSTDGVNWATTSTSVPGNSYSVTYGNGIFVAVLADGTDRVMTSPDGINWTPQTAAEANVWYSVTYGNGLFVAVAGSGTNRVMTSPDGIVWSPRTAAQASFWYSVTYGDGTFVAVTDSGTSRVMTSSNGINWTPQTAAQANPWNSVTYGNGLFVAVSGVGSLDIRRVMVARSKGLSLKETVVTDVFGEYVEPITGAGGGQVWTARSAAENNDYWQSVTYGEGLFVAVACGTTACNTTTGDRVMTSSDGITWATTTAAGNNDQWQSVTYGEGLFVAVGNGGDRVMYSSNGVDWTTGSAAGNDDSWNSVTYGNGTFVAVGNGGDRVMYSTDGITWATTTAAEANNWVSVAYGNGVFVAVSDFATNEIMTSPDGITWTARSGGDQVNLWSSVTYGNGIFVAVAQSGTGYLIMSSTDGITWTPRLNSGSNNWQSVIYANGQFIAVASSGTNRVMTSPDGITWTARTEAEANQWQSVAYGNEVLVAVSQTGTNRVMTASAGATSTSLTTVFLDDDSLGRRAGIVMPAQAAAGVDLYPNNLEVYTPENGGVLDFSVGTLYGAIDDGNVPLNQIATTTTAVGFPNIPIELTVATGTTLKAGANLELYGDLTLSGSFNDNNGTVYFYGPDPVVTGDFTGTNNFNDVVVEPTSQGQSWSVLDPLGVNQDWDDIAYGNNTFAVIEDDSVITSPDGISWTSRVAGTEGEASWNDITYGNGTFVAVGFCNGFGFVECAMYSTDSGVTWATTTAAGNNDAWEGIAYGNGTFVAVGRSGDRVMTSPDGINWTVRSAAGNNDNWTSVTYGNGLFVAVGSSGDRVMTSPNGITWTVRSAAGNNDTWRDVTFGNGVFVAVGECDVFIDCIMTSPNGTTWTVQTEPNPDDLWQSITFGNGVFVAVGRGDFYPANTIMTSSDGVTWSTFVAPSDNNDAWGSVGYGNGIFVAGAFGGNNRFMIANPQASFSTSSLQDLTTATTSLTVLNSEVVITGDVLHRGKIENNSTLTFAGESDISLLGSAPASEVLGSVVVTGHATFTTPVSLSNLSIETGGSLVASTSITLTGSLTQNGSVNFSDTTLILGGGNTQYIEGSFTGTNEIGAISLPLKPVHMPLTVDGNNDWWDTVTYGGNLFVALGYDNLVAYSSDGVNWSTSTPAQNNQWSDVVYGNNTYVAVSTTGTNRAMTSTNGVTWTARSIVGNNENWNGITYGDGLFVAVSQCENFGTDCVAYSSDGATWISTPAAGGDDSWNSVAYGNGTFVAVGSSGTDRVMYSTDGISWATTSAAGNDDLWFDVEFANGLFVAVSYSGDGVMTSPDGINWTVRQTAEDNFNWNDITYGSGLFVVTSSDFRQFMVSSDAISWQLFPKRQYDCGCRDIVYGDGLFIEVGNNAIGTIAVATSGPTFRSSVTAGDISIEPFSYLAASSTVTVLGNYENRGTFEAASSTVVFAGTSAQTATGNLSGTSAFYNLTINNTSRNGTTSRSMTFGAPLEVDNTFTMTASSSAAFLAGATTTLQNIDLQGTASSPVWLRSTATGTDWYLDVPGSQLNVEYVNVKDSTASSTIIATDSFDAGNNVNWNFVSGGVTGSSTIAAHDAGQVSNAFSFQNRTNEELYAFKLIPTSGTTTITDLVVTLTGVKNVDQTDFSNIRLLRDYDNDGQYDATDGAVGGAGVMSITSGAGTITFTGDFSATTTQNFIVVADWNAPDNGSFMRTVLQASGVTSVDGNGTQAIFGSVGAIQHNRNNKGGAGLAAEDIGGAPPAGAGTQTGGGNSGGEQIGNDPNFRRPTSNNGDVWTNPQNAYDQINDSYATRGAGASGWFQDNNFYVGHTTPSNNQIVGIEVRLEASATNNDESTLGVTLTVSETPVGDTKITSALTTTDTVLILGGPADTWGRSWTVSDANNIGMIITPDSIGFTTTVRIDEIQVRVYYQTTGGGGGGGADI